MGDVGSFVTLLVRITRITLFFVSEPQARRTLRVSRFFPDRGKTDQEKGTLDNILARITRITLFLFLPLNPVQNRGRPSLSN